MVTDNSHYTLSPHAYDRMLTRSKQSPVWLEEILNQGHFVQLPDQVFSGRRYALVHDAYCDVFLVVVIAPDTQRVITVLSKRYYEAKCGRILPHNLRLARLARYKLQSTVARASVDTPPQPDIDEAVTPAPVVPPTVNARLRPANYSTHPHFPDAYELGTHVGRSLAQRLALECEPDLWDACWTLWGMTTGRPMEEGLRIDVPLRLRHACIGNSLLALARETWVQELTRGDEPMDFRNQLRLLLNCKHFSTWFCRRISMRRPRAVENIDRILATSEADENRSYVDLSETLALVLGGQDCGPLEVNYFRFAPQFPIVRDRKKAVAPDAELEAEGDCLATCG